MIPLLKYLHKIELNLTNKVRVSHKIKSTNNCYKKAHLTQELTKEQKKEIRDYYYKLTGMKVPLAIHRYFSARLGEYHKDFVPTPVYRTVLLHRANRYGYRDAYADKNMVDVVLPNAPIPEIILKNLNGYFYINNKPVSQEEAAKHIYNLEDAIIKPSLKAKGDGVRKLVIKDGKTNIRDLDVDGLFKFYQEDFIIQRLVHQHPAMAELNDSSVNTIRVVSYRSGMEILILYAISRMGLKGMEIDNQSAGGLVIGLNEDGTMKKYAYGEPGVERVEKNSDGVVFEGRQIPSFDKIIEKTKELHLQLPFFNILGWDWSVDEKGEPVLIEWNVYPGLSQSACGPAFGKYNERVFTELMKKPDTKLAFYMTDHDAS